jgi:hypothetical protein
MAADDAAYWRARVTAFRPESFADVDDEWVHACTGSHDKAACQAFFETHVLARINDFEKWQKKLNHRMQPSEFAEAFLRKSAVDASGADADEQGEGEQEEVRDYSADEGKHDTDEEEEEATDEGERWSSNSDDDDIEALSVDVSVAGVEAGALSMLSDVAVAGAGDEGLRGEELMVDRFSRRGSAKPAQPKAVVMDKIVRRTKERVIRHDVFRANAAGNPTRLFEEKSRKRKGGGYKYRCHSSKGIRMLS